jgi:chromosome segregation ATPase
MSIDERLEAIGHSVELLAGMQIETERRLARLTEKVDRLTDRSDFLQTSMTTLAERSNILQTSMATLADGMELLTRITLDHHDRIDRLGGNQPPQ